MKRFVARHRPSPSMAVALTALMVALGGTGYAAIKLPKNAVGTKQLKKNAVTGAKVKDGSLFSNDFASGQIPKGPKGDTGATGAPGTNGTNGANGKDGKDGVTQVIVRRRPGDVPIALGAGSSVDLITTTLPAGKWEVRASTNGLDDGSMGSSFFCGLTADGTGVEPFRAQALGGNSPGAVRGAIFSSDGAVTSTGATIVKFICNHDGAVSQGQFGPKFASSRLEAIRADTLDVQDVSG